MAITLQDIGTLALRVGLNPEGARVAMAIAQTEGGLGGDVGDQSIGGSYGPFQFYTGGMLPAYAKALGVSTQEAGQVATQYPEHAAAWALSGYLGQAIRAGQEKGLSGVNLATYAQTYGQRSESPERAGANYAALFGGGQQMPYQQTGPGPQPAPTPTPQPWDNASGLNPEEEAILRQYASGPPPTPGAVPAGPTGSGNEIAGLGIPSAYPAGPTNFGTTGSPSTGVGLTIEQIEQRTGKKVLSMAPEPTYIDVPDPDAGRAALGYKVKAPNPDKSATRITFVDGSYLMARERTGATGGKVYEVTNSGDAFKTPGASGGDTALDWLKFDWQRKQDELRNQVAAGDKSVAQAKAEADLWWAKAKAEIDQRGQEITMRGQNLNTATSLASTVQNAVNQDVPNYVPKGASGEMNKVAAAWDTPGKVAKVDFKPVSLPYGDDPSQEGMRIASELLKMPFTPEPYNPNSVRAPSITGVNVPPPVNLAGAPTTVPLGGAGAVAAPYAVTAPNIVNPRHATYPGAIPTNLGPAPGNPYGP